MKKMSFNVQHIRLPVAAPVPTEEEWQAIEKKWSEKHKGSPLCVCAHSPPCAACKASIEKYGCS